MRPAWIVLGVLASVPACSKEEGATASEGTSAKTTDSPETAAKQDKPLTPKRVAVVDAWKKEGLTATLAAGSGFGKDCSTGTVDKLEVVICEYGNADEAKQAEQPGLDWVGTTTGAAWASGSLVIAVADRKKSDPHGKTINQLMKSAPK